MEVYSQYDLVYRFRGKVSYKVQAVYKCPCEPTVRTTTKSLSVNLGDTSIVVASVKTIDLVINYDYYVWD